MATKKFSFTCMIKGHTHVCNPKKMTGHVCTRCGKVFNCQSTFPRR